MAFMPFTNTWIGPARQGQGYKVRNATTDRGKPGNDTAPDATVVSAVLPFPDGSRSVAGPYRKGYWIPHDWPTNGWRPVYTNYGAPGSTYANWPPYMPGPQTAAYLDSLLAKGYVLMFLDSDVGNAGAKSGNNWPPGWYAHPLKGVWPEDVANFTWGMSQLNQGSTQAAQQGMPPGMQPPPQQPMMPQGPPPPPPVGFFGGTAFKVLAAVVVLGIVVYAIE